MSHPNNVPRVVGVAARLRCKRNVEEEFLEEGGGELMERVRLRGENDRRDGFHHRSCCGGGIVVAAAATVTAIITAVAAITAAAAISVAALPGEIRTAPHNKRVDDAVARLSENRGEGVNFYSAKPSIQT